MCLPHRKVTFEVWDRDNGWNDDLLGRVSVIPTSGHISKNLKLNHGSLTVKMNAVCAPSLQGSLCEQYAATPTYEEVMRYGTADQEGGGSVPAAPDGVTL